MLAQFTVLRIYADISSWGMIMLVCECRNDPMVIEFIVSCLEYPGTFKLLAKGISASFFWTFLLIISTWLACMNASNGDTYAIFASLNIEGVTVLTAETLKSV